MSLAVAIESVNGIVLAADSRATFGDPRGMTAVNDTVQKIFKPSSRTALAMVGAAEIGAAVMQVIASGLASQPDANVDVVADMVRSLATQHFSQWFGPPQFVLGPAGGTFSPRPDVVFVLAGYDANDQAKILTLQSTLPFNFAPNLSTTGFAAVGVVPLAVYLLNRFYRHGLALEIAEDLAAYCILETASQDGKVGGPIRAAVVKHAEDTRLLPDDEISELLRRAEKHRDTLRTSFENLAVQPRVDALPEALAAPTAQEQAEDKPQSRT
jgi:20S proteasome alpha/beta subunit